MKVQRILDEYLHSHIRKSAGDWDDISNVPDITDSFTQNNQNPFDTDFWKDKMFDNPEVDNFRNNSNKNKLNIIV